MIVTHVLDNNTHKTFLRLVTFIGLTFQARQDIYHEPKPILRAYAWYEGGIVSGCYISPWAKYIPHSGRRHNARPYWRITGLPNIVRGHFVYVPSKWETTLLCNVVSNWLGAYTKCIGAIRIPTQQCIRNRRIQCRPQDLSKTVCSIVITCYLCDVIWFMCYLS